jgi:hypothetical protein
LSNVRGYFPDIDSRFKFTLLNAHKGVQAESFRAAFRIDLRVGIAPAELPAFVENPNNFMTVRREMLEQFNPESLSVMEFQTPQDYEIASKIVDAAPKIRIEVEGTWNPQFVSGLHKTNLRQHFNAQGKGLPVYEGKNLSFYGENLQKPSIWMLEQAGKKLQPDYSDYRFGFRRIARSTDHRTLIVSYLPQNSFAMYTLTTLKQGMLSRAEEMFLYACMASYVLDYYMRFQATSSVAIFNVNSLPVPRLVAGDAYFDAIVPRAARLTCTDPAFADLWRAVMGSEWTAETGASDPAERQKLRDEIDGLVARLYGLTRDEYAHVLASFPLVFPDNEAGAARRAEVLAAYDRMRELVQSSMS